jgi:hypothetical protein
LDGKAVASQVRITGGAPERSDAGRFIVHADQELPAFLELESAIQIDRHNHERDCGELERHLRALSDRFMRSPLLRVGFDHAEQAVSFIGDPGCEVEAFIDEEQSPQTIKTERLAVAFAQTPEESPGI